MPIPFQTGGLLHTNMPEWLSGVVLSRFARHIGTMTVSEHHHELPQGGDLSSAAAEVMKAHGEQWTEMRAAVFGALCELKKPASAYTVAELVSKKLGRRVAANSMYRILDLFVSQNIALRIESCNAFVPNTHPGCVHDCIFLICDACGSVAHLDEDSVGLSVRTIAAAQGFAPARPLIEVHGRCISCLEPVQSA